HLPERADHLHRRFQVSLLELLPAALLGAGHVRGLGPGVARALHADDRAELRRAANAPLGDPVFVGHRDKRATGAPLRGRSLSSPGQMAATRETLKAAPRPDFGSRTSRRLRRDGLVPGVVYGGGSEARPFQAPERDVRTVLAGGHALFDLELEGSKKV